MKKSLTFLALSICSLLGYSQENSNVPLYSSGYLALPNSIGEFSLSGAASTNGLNHHVFSLGSLTAGKQASIYSIPSMSGSHGPKSALSRAALNYALDETTTIVASLGYFSAGDVELRDAEGNVLGQFTPNETDLRVGVVKQLGEGFNFGTRLGYLSTNLGSSINSPQITESSLLVDFSLDYLITSTREYDLTAYWSLTNIGRKSTFSEDNLNYLPTQMALGILLEYELNDDLKFAPQLMLQKFLVPTPPLYNADGTIFSGQAQNTSAIGSLFTSFNDAPEGTSEELKEWCPILAVELTLREKIKVNLGGAFESQDKGNRQYITTGIGYTTEKAVLNAAYIIPLSDLAGYYQGLFGIGVSYRF